MMKNKRTIILIILFSMALTGTLATMVMSGPSIIRDNRIYDLALTPVLGRGYSISTNTFQSTCLKDIKITKPSYDFNYTFERMDKEETQQKSTTIGGSVDVSYMAFNARVSGSATEIDKKMFFYQNVRVEVNVDTYYASVDESATSLADSPKTLLLNNDIPGFFHSCGSYYIRSIGRTSKFVSLFTYLNEDRERDKEFELQLELAIKGFAADIAKAAGAGAGALTMSIKGDFKTKATSKRLTITTKAWGLGKNENASLIAHDLETYKNAIKDAFMSMQDPMVGRVTTMEIVPWVENADFQRYIKLEEDVTNDKGEKLLLFEKKHILNLNAEFLARIDRTARSLSDIYYKALICRQIIDNNWKRGKQFIRGLEGARIQNNRKPGTMPIAELDKELSDATLEKLYKDEDEFMYGKDGARDCIKAIMQTGVFRTSWRDIEVCKNIRGKFSTVINENIDDFCMPKLANEEQK